MVSLVLNRIKKSKLVDYPMVNSSQNCIKMSTMNMMNSNRMTLLTKKKKIHRITLEKNRNFSKKKKVKIKF